MLTRHLTCCRGKSWWGLTDRVSFCAVEVWCTITRRYDTYATELKGIRVSYVCSITSLSCAVSLGGLHCSRTVPNRPNCAPYRQHH